MLILNGIVLQVVSGKESIDKTTGAVIPATPSAEIQHKLSMEADASFEIEKIKLKSPAQVDAFRKSIGKTINIPCRQWVSGGKAGLYLEAGVLPTVASTPSN